jgi:hypothetical protein
MGFVKNIARDSKALHHDEGDELVGSGAKVER